MDMLYSRYSNPLNLISLYINQGRFGEFVKGFIDEEYKRQVEEAEKEKDMKLWIAYIHSFSDLDYETWKKQIIPKGNDRAKNGDLSLDDNGIQAIIDNLFPKTSKE